jgi:holin-like protein
VRLFETVAPHFPLFFIPAAVGVVASIELLSQTWLFFVAAIVFSTAVTIAVTGYLAQLLLERLRRSRTPHHDSHHVERLA